MAARPLVDLDFPDTDPVVIEPVPNDETCLLMSAASGTAYHKSTIQKMKSFIGTKARGNAKGLTKQAVHFGFSHIPIAGPYVALGFNVASQKAEGVYKKKKAEKLRRQRETDTAWEEDMKAQLKTMTFQNALGEIDKSRKKVEMSAEECVQWWGIDLDSCGACAEAFYHWYRLEQRAGKLKVKVALLKEVLDHLEDYANKQLTGSWKARRDLISAVNEFTTGHVNPCKEGKIKLTYFKDVCTIDLKGQQNLQDKEVKGSLLD
jgi:hypothetical protein